MSKDLILVLTSPESPNQNLNIFQQWPALRPYVDVRSINADDDQLAADLNTLFKTLSQQANNPRAIHVITHPERKGFIEHLFRQIRAQFVNLSQTIIEISAGDVANMLARVQQKYTGEIPPFIAEKASNAASASLSQPSYLTDLGLISEDTDLTSAPTQNLKHSVHYCSLVLDGKLTAETWYNFLATRKEDTQVIVIAPVNVGAYQTYRTQGAAQFYGLAGVLYQPNIVFIPIATALDAGKPQTNLVEFQECTESATKKITELTQHATKNTIIIVPSTTEMIPAFGDGSGNGGKLPTDLSNEANQFFKFVKECAVSHQALAVSQLGDYLLSGDPTNLIKPNLEKIEQKAINTCQQLIEDCLKQLNRSMLSKFFSAVEEKDILSLGTELAKIQLSAIPAALKEKINLLAHTLLSKIKENPEKPEDIKKYLLLLGTLRDLSSTPKPANQANLGAASAAATNTAEEIHRQNTACARQQFDSIIQAAIGDMTGVPREFVDFNWSDKHATVDLQTALQRVIENHYSDDTAMMIALLDAIEKFIVKANQSKQPIENIMPDLFQFFHNWCHRGAYNGELGGPTWGMGGLTSFVLKKAQLPLFAAPETYGIAIALNQQIQQGRDGNAAAMRVAPACLASAPGFVEKIENPVIPDIDPRLDHAMRLARVQADTAGSGADAISWAMLLAYFMVKLQIIKTQSPDLSGAKLAENLINRENLREFTVIAESQTVFALQNGFSEQRTISLSEKFLDILHSTPDENNPHYNWRNNERCKTSLHKGVNFKVYGGYSLDQMALILWVLQQIANGKINDLNSLLNLITGAGGDADTNAAVMMMLASFFPESLVESIRILNQRPINVTRRIPIAEEANLVKFALNILKLLWGEAVHQSLQKELTAAGILFDPTEAERLLTTDGFDQLISQIKHASLVTLLYPIPSHLQLLLDTDERPLYLSLAKHPSPSLLGEMFRRLNAAHHQKNERDSQKYTLLITKSLTAANENLNHYATFKNERKNVALPDLIKLFFMGTATDLAMPPPHVEDRQTYRCSIHSVTLYDWLTLPQDQALRQQLNQVLKNFLVLAHKAGCLADAEKALNPVIKKLTAAEQKEIFPAPGKKSPAELQQ